jgi:flagellin-like hook-associated protein FlgL
MAQTLEGGLAQMDIALQRIRELAVQASSDTYNSSDRYKIQQEVSQILDQIDLVSEQTNFNRINLLDGSTTSIGVYVDDGVQESSFEIQLHDIRESSVGRKAQYDSQRRGVHVSALNAGDVTINGHDVRATDASDDALSFSFASGSAIAKANAINAISELTGVTARAGVNEITANRQISAFTLSSTQNFSINGAKIGGFAIVDFDLDGALRQAINDNHEETGVVASLSANGELELVAADGRNIQIQYSHKNVLETIGLADTTLDPNNLAGDVVLGEPDRDLKGTYQNLVTSGGFAADLAQVGGRYDGSELAKDNYVDFVVHVVEGGGLGTAKVVFERDPVGGDPGAAEDFAFIEGAVNPAPNTGGVAGSFVALGGTIEAGGTYNEGLDRTYQLKVIQAGSTDGPDPAKRAVVQVSTVEDGVLIAALTLDAAAGPQNIATSTTGEFVTIDVGASHRAEAVGENVVVQEYAGTLGNGVDFGGVYTGDLSKEFRVTVVDEGYTQGNNKAKVNVTEFNTITGLTTSLGTFDVNAGQAITVGDGLDITFDVEEPLLGAIQEVDNNPDDSYAGAVSLVTQPIDFIGERGDGTYALEITEAGKTGLAKYRVLFDGQEIAGPTLLNVGNATLADGLEFNFAPSVSTIDATNFLSVGGDYGQHPTVAIGGNYDGNLNDIQVQVRVKSEGRVLTAGEFNTSDAAILEYSLDGGANFVGDIQAVAGQDLDLDNGLNIRFDVASAEVQFTDGNGVIGQTATLGPNELGGYQGQVDFSVDPDDFNFTEDATIELRTAGAVISNNGGAASGSVNVVLIDSDGVEQVFTLNNIQSGDIHEVVPGFKVTFLNPVSTVIDQTQGADDGANITLSNPANYNGSLGNSVLTVQYTGDTNTNIIVDAGINAADDLVGATLAGVYNGILGQETLTLSLTGVNPNEFTVVDSGGAHLGTFDAAAGVVDIAGTGVDLTFTDPANWVDDVIDVQLDFDQTVTVSVDGQLKVNSNGDSKFSVAGGFLDLQTVFEADDPGFDLSVANPGDGRDDAFTFELIRDQNIGADTKSIMTIDQETIGVGTRYETFAEAGTLEVGTRYEIAVEAPTLEAGKEYRIRETVGTLEVDDVITVDASHDFASGPITLDQTTLLSNGVQLEFNNGANFNIGDELRVQALQYQGDPIASGPYDDPAFPTTFEVEVVQGGAVDGGALIQYLRVDNGDTGVVNAESNATLLQNNVHIEFTAGTLYAGDRFVIETVSDLAQDFGAELILESAEGIEIELDSVVVDNELGRMLYVGDPALANVGGTFDSLTNGFLGVNSEQTVSEVDLTTKEGAQEALRIVDLAIDQIGSFRSETGATQNRIERQLGSLSESLFQTESYVSRLRDADVAFEVAELAQSQILQNAGVQMLAQINVNTNIALQLIQGLS